MVADRWINVVVSTPSAKVHHENPMGGRAGVSFGNRLRSLNTTPSHPNCIQAGKRSRITLTPTLVLKEGKPVLAISVAGGDLQDQAALELLLNHIDFGQLPETSVRTPRFATHHHQNSFDPNPNRQRTFLKAGSLAINDRIDSKVRQDVAGRSHQVEAKSAHIATPVMLYIDPAGLFHAEGDPEAGRHAAGLED